MNSCILMAEIIQDPQLRYTTDNQTPIAEMLVQFPGSRPEDPPATLKVVGWGNLAQDIQQHYHQGDRVIIEGRLSMNTLDRPEGFKEKRAELTVQRIHSLDGTSTLAATPSAPPAARAATPSATRPPAAAPNTRPGAPTPAPSGNFVPSPSPQPTVPAYSAPAGDQNYDDIPF